MYHERQRWAYCGVHAMNNLLQTKKYDKTDFDQVCQELVAPDDAHWINPHKSILGVGNYDVNVLMVVLEQQLGFQVKWHDCRKEINLNDAVVDDAIVVNVPSTSLWGKVTKGRHWLTLLRKGDSWINLDSGLKEPQVIGDAEACTKLLNEWRSKHEECHILLVKMGKQEEE